MSRTYSALVKECGASRIGIPNAEKYRLTVLVSKQSVRHRPLAWTAIKGAGDQGMMFGYASTKHPKLAALSVAVSHPPLLLAPCGN